MKQKSSYRYDRDDFRLWILNKDFDYTQLIEQECFIKILITSNDIDIEWLKYYPFINIKDLTLTIIVKNHTLFNLSQHTYIKRLTIYQYNKTLDYINICLPKNIQSLTTNIENGIGFKELQHVNNIIVYTKCSEVLINNLNINYIKELNVYVDPITNRYKIDWLVHQRSLITINLNYWLIKYLFKLESLKVNHKYLYSDKCFNQLILPESIRYLEFNIDSFIPNSDIIIKLNSKITTLRINDNTNCFDFNNLLIDHVDDELSFVRQLINLNIKCNDMNCVTFLRNFTSVECLHLETSILTNLVNFLPPNISILELTIKSLSVEIESLINYEKLKCLIINSKEGIKFKDIKRLQTYFNKHNIKLIYRVNYNIIK